MMIYRKGLVNIMLLLFLFVLISHSVFGLGELRCKPKEREALLMFKKGLIDEDGCLRWWSIEEDKKECCEWKGVKCSNETGHVIRIQLDYYDMDCLTPLSGNISSALLELSYLHSLDLSFNDFAHAEIPKFIGSLKRLRHLSLSYCNFSGVVPHQLGNLTNLRTLDLRNNALVFKNLNWLSHLSLLSVLDLSSTSLRDIKSLQHIFMIPSLTELYLSECEISTHFFVSTFNIGLIASSANISVKLRRMDLSFNNLSVIPVNLGSFSRLEHLDLSWNQLTGLAPDLSGLVSLKELIIAHNKLERLSTSLWQLSNLEVLDAVFNSFEGTISDVDLSKLQNLKVLDLSYNSLVLNFIVDWIPPFQLEQIGLACCKMGPRFPAWLQTQTNLSMIDISWAGISDKVPKWLWNLSPRMVSLNLSHNQISGTIPHLPLVTDISYNNFSGRLPLFHPNSFILQLNNNMFSGSISSICRIVVDALEIFDLSNNKLSKELPNCWDNMTALLVLNLNNNRLSGQIPHSIGSLTSLVTLHLGDNNFSLGLPSSTLKNCKLLSMIDVGGNNLTGNIPPWIGTHLKRLNFLILGHNNFDGTIPPEICYLNLIQVLDLSRNSLSGTIPQCLYNFSSLVKKNNQPDVHIFEYQYAYYINHIGEFIDNALVQWKGQEAQYRRTLRLLKLIDLSSNKLFGNIPREFSLMRGLISLNLSRNYLSGNIISNIGEMEMLECLDLSRNQLSSEIPTSLAELHLLAVLDLSNNSLSGKIPSSTQLQSFNASAYIGNSELCGPPLQACPEDGPKPPIASHATPDQTDDGLVNLEFIISMVFGFIFGFWGVVGTLIVKNSWRNAYFNFFNKIKDWFYVITTVYARRLCGNLRDTART